MKSEDFLFVDTTIQVHKAIGTDEKIAKIITRLERADNVVTPDYVLMEFNRRVISDSIWLYDLMKEIRTLAQLLRRISQEGFGRQKQTTISILAKLFEELAEEMHLMDTPAFWDKTLGKLEELIDWQLHEQFFDGIDLALSSLTNATECSIAHQLPTKLIREGKSEYVYKYTCRREEARCRLPQFLQGHSDELLAVEQILKSKGANAELQKALNALERIHKHPQGWNAAKGGRNCWRLGDIIIALEMPKGYTLLTTNARHFVPLCEALGKKCEILPL